MTQKQDIVSMAHCELNTRIVAINHAALVHTRIPSGELKLMESGLAEPWHTTPHRAIAFMIALNSINYMFWSLGSVNGKKALIRYEYAGKVGANGMRAAFDQIWGDPKSHKYFRSEPITQEWVIQRFGNIPDPESRASLLSEIFADQKLEEVALQLYHRILAKKAVSTEDALLLHEAFPRAYNDRYMKRAQLALFWIAGFFSECGLVLDTTDLTAFADYQVPRALRALGILEYSPGLAEKIDSLTILDEGSPEERAIRAATIVACEMLAAANHVTAGEIDNFLWTNRNIAGATPFHLTFTEQY